MALTITSLRVDYRTSSKGNMRDETVPYIMANCTFRITDSEFLKEVVQAESEDFKETLTLDDPERYEKWIVSESWNVLDGYDGWGKAWTLRDPEWEYLAKFDTFWWRQWIADTPATRFMLEEIDYYRRFGKLKAVYRHEDEGIILRHLRALSSYWD